MNLKRIIRTPFRRLMKLEQAIRIINRHKKDLSIRGVNSLSIFGSTVKGETTSSSDVDILIDYESKKGLFAFVDLKLFLEKILDCPVDLVTKNALHPALKERILHEAKHVF